MKIKLIKSGLRNLLVSNFTTFSGSFLLYTSSKFMSDTREIYFHVGLPKAASTFLQRNVFPNFKNIHFIKKHDFKRHTSIIANSSAGKILLSIELNLDVENGYSKMQSVANNYPGSKPIIVFRRHGSWLKSKYKYYLRKHGSATFNEYFDASNEKSVLPNEQLNFYDKIKLLETKYKVRPLVLFHEELIKDPVGFIETIATYMGAEYDIGKIKISNVKKSYSEKQLYYVRKFNRSYHFEERKFTRYKFKLNKLYKKYSALLLHSVAYAGAVLPTPKELKQAPLIDKKQVDNVNNAYENDWNKCLEYAKKDRKLLIGG